MVGEHGGDPGFDPLSRIGGGSEVEVAGVGQHALFPKIAKVPCSNCETKLDAAIKAGEGKTTLGDLNLETTMLRNYFAWAGGRSPSTAAPEAPAPAEDKKEEKK